MQILKVHLQSFIRPIKQHLALNLYVVDLIHFSRFYSQSFDLFKALLWFFWSAYWHWLHLHCYFRFRLSHFRTDGLYHHSPHKAETWELFLLDTLKNECLIILDSWYNGWQLPKQLFRERTLSLTCPVHRYQGRSVSFT